MAKEKKKDDSSSDSNDAKELNENYINIDDDDDPRESGLEIGVHISSPLLDEADVERLKHKGFKKALLEILNSDPRKPKFGISVNFSSPFFDDDDVERIEHNGFDKVILEILNMLEDETE